MDNQIHRVSTDEATAPAVRCNQAGCIEPAAFRFTWPGKDEAGICAGHEPKLRGVASLMGLYLQIIPLAKAEGSSEL